MIHSNQLKRLFVLLLAVVMLLNVTACDKEEPQLPTVGVNNNTDSESFQKFCNDFFADIVTESTITLHSFVQKPENFGITDYEVKLDNMSLEDIQDTTELVETINKLKTFNRSELSAKQQIVYDKLLKKLTSSLDASDLYLYGSSLTPSMGIQVQLPTVFVTYDFSKKRDIDDYIELINQVDDYFEYLIEFEKLRAKEGLFMEDSIADSVVTQCQTFLDGLEDNNFLIHTFNEKVDEFEGLTDDERVQYKTGNAAAINNSLIPAYKYLIAELPKLKGSCQYSGGLCNQPNGKKYYEYLMQNNLGWSLSIDELDKMVDDYLLKAIADIQLQVLADKNLATQLDSYRFDITEPDAIIKDLKEKIKKDFPDAPELPYTLFNIDKALEDFANPATYFLPPVDNLNRNHIFINQSKVSDATTLYTTLAHEGYPGHMYQITYFNLIDDCPLNWFLNPDGYTEGWASYCETYSYTFANTGNERLNRVMADNYFATLLIYAKADMGINYYGWDKAKLGEFLKQYGYNTSDIIDSFYEAMVSEPCIYPSYSIGCLAFVKMRETAINELGDKFNAKEFHKFLMDIGPIDFDLLEPYFNTWLSKQK